MSPPDESRSRVRRRLREAAVEYVTHGWPVAPLAVPDADGCSCGGRCPSMHPLSAYADGITTQTIAARVWTADSWPIAVVTAHFEVLDVPGTLGSRIHGQLKTRCPTATTRPGRRFGWILEPGPVRWQLYLQPGSVDPAKVSGAGGTLHAGPDGWTPAPPSHTPATGRVRWVVPPGQARWTPYQRLDVFDTLGLT